jgi:hypothetical protein
MTLASNQIESPSQAPAPPIRAHRVPAWLLSVGLHASMIAAALGLLQGIRPRGSKVENRTGGIVLVDRQTETTRYLSEGESAAQASSRSTFRPPSPLPDRSQRPDDLSGPEMAHDPNADEVAENILNSLPTQQGLTDGVNNAGADVGGQTTVEVFGVKGTGSSFVYLFDRSGSMEGYAARPLRAAKQELLQSLESLGSNQQFQIIFYNDSPVSFQPDQRPTGLLFATQRLKRSAVRFVESINGDGGTDHVTALKFALRFRPDVIFLLTDAEGGLTGSELDVIASFNRGHTVINTIEFGEGTGERSDRSLQQLATQHRGQYVYKDITTLAHE